MPDRKQPVAIAIAVASALALSGCAGGSAPSLGPAGIVSGSLGASVGAGPQANAAKPEAPEQTTANPAVATTVKGATATSTATLTLARALRDKGEKSKALAELERGRREKPADREIAREAGILALELGQIEKAKQNLSLALDPAQPDFHVLAALGTAHASSANQREAQAHYKQALKLKPDHQPTLNNLALSYALEGDLAKAESALKVASKGTQTPQQVKENLVLVMALAGKFDDAEKAAAGLMPKAKTAANMAYLRSMTEKEKGG